MVEQIGESDSVYLCAFRIVHFGNLFVVLGLERGAGTIFGLDLLLFIWSNSLKLHSSSGAVIAGLELRLMFHHLLNLLRNPPICTFLAN